MKIVLPLIMCFLVLTACTVNNMTDGDEILAPLWNPTLVPVLPSVKEIVEPRKILEHEKMDYIWTEMYMFIRPLTLGDTVSVTAIYSVGLDQTIRIAGKWVMDLEEPNWYIEENTNARMLVRFIPYQFLRTEHGEPMSNRVTDAVNTVKPEGHLRVSTFIYPHDESVSRNTSVAVRELTLKQYNYQSNGVAVFISGENGVFMMLANLGEELPQDLGKFVRFIDNGRDFS